MPARSMLPSAVVPGTPPPRPVPPPLAPQMPTVSPSQRAVISSPFEPTEFRAALRKAKIAVKLDDRETNDLVNLLVEGERHYRIRSSAILVPRDQEQEIERWQTKVARTKPGEVVIVPILGSPRLESIVADMGDLCGEVERRLDVVIPLHEFNRS